MASSVYLKRKQLAIDVATDETYLIYGDSGSGKTFLASTFPKTQDLPLLYVNILEDGIGSAELNDQNKIEVVLVETFKEADDLFSDVYRGYTIDDSGKQHLLKFSAVVLDSLTNLEFLVKKYLKEQGGKATMTQNLWGQKMDTDESLFMLIKSLSRQLKIPIVAIAHTKSVSDDENPAFNKQIPSLQDRAARSLAAKCSFVWFTKTETVTTVVGGKAQRDTAFFTYIGSHPYLLTKARKPKSMVIPQRIQNLTYEKFKKNVLDKLKLEEK